jgi:hypothetical protein
LHGGGEVSLSRSSPLTADASKQYLMIQAKKLEISGRTRMTKAELIDAI